VDTAGGYTCTQKAGCRATLALVVVPQFVVVVVILSSSSLTTQLAFRHQQRLHLDQLPFIDKGAAAAGKEAGDMNVQEC